MNEQQIRINFDFVEVDFFFFFGGGGGGSYQ